MPRTLTASYRLLITLESAIASLIVAIGYPLILWWRRHCYRCQLRSLLHRGPRLIEDMGMTVEEAEYEAGEPFWRSRDLPPLRPI